MLYILTPPTTEPVTLDEAKAQAVISGTADDALLSLIISAARAHGENLTSRSWAPQTVRVVLDCFPRRGGPLLLPRGPVSAVTSVKYIGVDGAETTLDAALYETQPLALIAEITPAHGTVWPSTAKKPGAVVVEYVAGWTAEQFPLPLKQWLLITISSLYAQRENFLIGSSAGQNVAKMPRNFCDALLDEYIVPGGCG